MTASNAIRVLSVLALMSCDGAYAQAPRSDAVRVYDSTEIAYSRYTVIRRLGVEGPRSAFRIPGHRDLESARQALVNEAAGLGADGVINLACFDQTDRIFRPAGYFCYGNAIRLQNERRVK
jgi:hypothetical protein